MKKIINVLFISRDRDYADALSEAIEYGFYSINIWTHIMDMKEMNIDLIMDELGIRENEINLILVDINLEIKKENIKKYNAKLAFLTQNANSKMEHSIFRLDKASIIIAQILNLASGKVEYFPSMNTKKETKLITVLQTAGGLGSSTVAMSIAHEIKRVREASVLYIDGKALGHGHGDFNYTYEDLSLRTILYYIVTGQSKKLEMMEKYLGEDHKGVKAFYIDSPINALTNITEEDSKAFVKYLIESSTFDYIIFDMGTEYYNCALEFMNLSNVYVILFDSMSLQEKNHFSYLDNNTDMEKDKIIFVKNKQSHRDELIKQFFMPYNKEENMEYMNIAYAADYFEVASGKLCPCLEGEFGGNIGELTEKIFTGKFT